MEVKPVLALPEGLEVTAYCASACSTQMSRRKEWYQQSPSRSKQASYLKRGVIHPITFLSRHEDRPHVSSSLSPTIEVAWRAGSGPFVLLMLQYSQI